MIMAILNLGLLSDIIDNLAATSWRFQEHTELRFSYLILLCHHIIEAMTEFL